MPGNMTSNKKVKMRFNATMTIRNPGQKPKTVPISGEKVMTESEAKRYGYHPK